MSPEIIGIIGGALIIFAWILETVESVKRHKSLIDLKFSAMFLVASALMVTYSWQIGNAVFLAINAVILAILSIEVLYSIHIKKIHKSGKK